MLSPPHWHNSQQPSRIYTTQENSLYCPQDMSTLDNTLASGKVVMVHRGVHLLGSSHPQYPGVGMSRLTCPDQQETNMQHLAPAVTTLVHCSLNVLLTESSFHWRRASIVLLFLQLQSVDEHSKVTVLYWLGRNHQHHT